MGGSFSAPAAALHSRQCLQKPHSSPAPLSTTLTYTFSDTVSTVFHTVCNKVPRSEKRPLGRKSPRREGVRSSAGAGVIYPPFFGGHSRSIPQSVILDVQPLVKSLFCPIRASPNGFFDSEASIP